MYHRSLKHETADTLSRFKLNLKNSLTGLTVLKSLPSVVFFNSVRYSYWATSETYALHIPSGGLTDSDALPDSVLYPIPGNDDAFGSLYFFNKLVAKMVLISKMSRIGDAYIKFWTHYMDQYIRLVEEKLRRVRKRRRKRFYLLRAERRARRWRKRYGTNRA